MTRVPRSWLYVPGHHTDRLAKALDAGADAVAVDLVDAVPPDRKHDARAAVSSAVALAGEGGPQVWVRIKSGRRR